MTERTNVWKLRRSVCSWWGRDLVTGLVVANRTGSRTETPVAALSAPAPAPATVQTPPPAVVQAPPPAVTEAPRPAAPPAATPPRRVAQTPSQSTIEACNREAANATGGHRDKKGKITEVVKDGPSVPLAAPRWEPSRRHRRRGKGAGKGAIIAVSPAPAAAASMASTQQEERRAYRTAYSSCMRPGAHDQAV